MAKKELALGKGLGALLGDAETVEKVREQVLGTSDIYINDITVNPYQPRINFDEEALKELAESIREHGIIQPITVRLINDKYQIISGERRFRAAKIAGLQTIPAYIRTSDDQGMLELRHSNDTGQYVKTVFLFRHRCRCAVNNGELSEACLSEVYKPVARYILCTWPVRVQGLYVPEAWRDVLPNVVCSSGEQCPYPKFETADNTYCKMYQNASVWQIPSGIYSRRTVSVLSIR